MEKSVKNSPLTIIQMLWATLVEFKYIWAALTTAAILIGYLAWLWILSFQAVQMNLTGL